MPQAGGGCSFCAVDVLLNACDRRAIAEQSRGGQGNPFDYGYFFDFKVIRYASTAPAMNGYAVTDPVEASNFCLMAKSDLA